MATPPRIIIKPLRVSDLNDPKVATIQPGEGFVVENASTTEQYYKRFSDGIIVKLDGAGGGSGGAYVHPTSDGNLHVPATGTTSNGRYLRAGATPGVFSWALIDWTEIVNKPNSFYTLPIASPSVLGGVKIGSDFTIGSDGTLGINPAAVGGGTGGNTGGSTGNGSLFEFNVNFTGSAPAAVSDLPSGWNASIQGNLVTVTHTAGKALKQINFWGYSVSGGIERYRLPSAANEVTIPYATRTSQFVFTISTSIAGADLDGSARVVVAF